MYNIRDLGNFSFFGYLRVEDGVLVTLGWDGPGESTR